MGILVHNRAMPSRYTHGHSEPVLRSHRWRTADNSAGYLLPHLRAGLRLLDVGPGRAPSPPTWRSWWVRARRPRWSTRRARSAHPGGAGRRGLDGVDYLVGDVHALDLPDGGFDVVHAHQVLQHVADPVTALRELLRVTADDGLVAVRDSDYSAFTW